MLEGVEVTTGQKVCVKPGGGGGACGCVMTDVLPHAEIQYFQV